MAKTLGGELRGARQARGLSLRDVERATGVHNAHLSQIETDSIQQPDLALPVDAAPADGRWETCCANGTVSTCYCPPDVTCNYGLGLVTCPDGRCGYYGFQC